VAEGSEEFERGLALQSSPDSRLLYVAADFLLSSAENLLVPLDQYLQTAEKK
jgi:hypothetical protein